VEDDSEDMTPVWEQIQKEYDEYMQTRNSVDCITTIAEIGDEFWKICRSHLAGGSTSVVMQKSCIRLAALSAVMYQLERTISKEN